MKHWLIMVFIALLTATAMTACIDEVAYDHYEHTPLSGWEKNDTLSFIVPPMTSSGNYTEELGLSISGNYPFLGLTLVTEQTIMPSMETRRDTLNCDLIDKHGNNKGSGVSQYQYLFHLTTLRLKEGESMHIAIRHDMKREILPGICDVGVTLRKAAN